MKKRLLLFKNKKKKKKLTLMHFMYLVLGIWLIWIGETLLVLAGEYPFHILLLYIQIWFKFCILISGFVQILGEYFCLKWRNRVWIIFGLIQFWVFFRLDLLFWDFNLMGLNFRKWVLRFEYKVANFKKWVCWEFLNYKVFDEGTMNWYWMEKVTNYEVLRNWNKMGYITRFINWDLFIIVNFWWVCRIFVICILNYRFG
jgi:hypothetical protein